MKRLFFNDLFNKAKEDLETEDTNAIAVYIAESLDEEFTDSRLSSKTIGRYIDKYVKDIELKDCKDPSKNTLNCLAQFMGFDTYNQYATKIRREQKNITHNYHADKQNITHIKDNHGDIHNY